MPNESLKSNNQTVNSDDLSVSNNSEHYNNIERFKQYISNISNGSTLTKTDNEDNEEPNNTENSDNSDEISLPRVGSTEDVALVDTSQYPMKEDIVPSTNLYELQDADQMPTTKRMTNLEDLKQLLQYNMADDEWRNLLNSRSDQIEQIDDKTLASQAQRSGPFQTNLLHLALYWNNVALLKRLLANPNVTIHDKNAADNTVYEELAYFISNPNINTHLDCQGIFNSLLLRYERQIQLLQYKTEVSATHEAPFVEQQTEKHHYKSLDTGKNAYEPFDIADIHSQIASHVRSQHELSNDDLNNRLQSLQQLQTVISQLNYTDNKKNGELVNKLVKHDMDYHESPTYRKSINIHAKITQKFNQVINYKRIFNIIHKSLLNIWCILSLPYLAGILCGIAAFICLVGFASSFPILNIVFYSLMGIGVLGNLMGGIAFLIFGVFEWAHGATFAAKATGLMSQLHQVVNWFRNLDFNPTLNWINRDMETLNCQTQYETAVNYLNNGEINAGLSQLKDLAENAHYAEACVKLAELYQQGETVEIDYKQTAYYYYLAFTNSVTEVDNADGYKTQLQSLLNTSELQSDAYDDILAMTSFTKIQSNESPDELLNLLQCDDPNGNNSRAATTLAIACQKLDQHHSAELSIQILGQAQDQNLSLAQQTRGLLWTPVMDIITFQPSQLGYIANQLNLPAGSTLQSELSNQFLSTIHNYNQLSDTTLTAIGAYQYHQVLAHKPDNQETDHLSQSDLDNLRQAITAYEVAFNRTGLQDEHSKVHKYWLKACIDQYVGQSNDNYYNQIDDLNITDAQLHYCLAKFYQNIPNMRHQMIYHHDQAIELANKQEECQLPYQDNQNLINQNNLGFFQQSNHSEAQQSLRYGSAASCNHHQL